MSNGTVDVLGKYDKLYKSLLLCKSYPDFTEFPPKICSCPVESNTMSKSIWNEIHSSNIMQNSNAILAAVAFETIHISNIIVMRPTVIAMVSGFVFAMNSGH